MYMIKVTFLGTSGSAPTKERNLPGVAMEYNGEVFLFDCGEGTQRQAIIYGVNLVRTKAVFISHIHGDHSIGVAGLVRTLALGRRPRPLQIYVPRGEERSIAPLIGFDRAVLGYEIQILPIKTGLIYRGKGFTVTAFRLTHSVNAHGFAFKEDDKVHFIKDKARKLGLKGAMFSQLQKAGRITIKGKTITLGSITTKEAGKKIVYATDTRPSKEIVNASRNADLLIYEATYANSEKDLAVERKHSTAQEAAELARRAHASRLVLTHISARYRNTQVLLKEAKSKFQNADIARDGLVVSVN